MNRYGIAALSVVWLGSGPVYAAPNDVPGSVATLAHVNGEAQIAHPKDAHRSDRAAYRGPVVYGDRITTAKEATLGLLVGQNSLLTMRELTEVRVAEAVQNQKILDVAKGSVCLAVDQSDGAAAILRTLFSRITARAGTLLRVDVDPISQTSQLSDEERGVVILTGTRARPAQEPTVAGGEMIHVLEGSASVAILSQPSSSSPITLRAGEAIRITNGVQGNPFTAPSVTCRVQDMQIIPVHITTPLPAQRLLVQQRIEQPIPFEIQKGPAPINDTIAAAPSAGTIPGGIYIPTTGSPPTVQTTIQVRLP